MSACGDDHTSSSAEDTSSSGETATSSDDISATEASETGSAVVGWPENWLGEYHGDTTIPLGQPIGIDVVFLPENLTVESDRASVQFYNCRDETLSEQSYRVTFDAGAAHLSPDEEGEALTWIEGAEPVLAELTLRPSDTCDGIEVVQSYGEALEGENTFVLPFVRGRLCVMDACDEPPFVLDYCEGTVQECDAADGESS